MLLKLIRISQRFMLVFVMLSVLAVLAKAQDDGFNSKARSVIMIEHESQAILYQKNADALLPPASMSKLMTIAIIFKALKAGEIKLTDKFVMSEHAWRTGGAPSRTSPMFVPINKSSTLAELIQGIIVQSGNDAAIAVAEGLAGSEQAFAKMMETEARRIGLTRSTFGNPTGLNHPNQLMTAREIAKLSSYLIDEYPEYYKMFAQKRFNYRRHKFINRNRLLFAKIGVDGLKTGYTKASGYSVALSAVQDGRRLIVVLCGFETSKERWTEARRILTWGFDDFRTFKLFGEDNVVGQARVWGGSQIFVPLVGNGPIEVVLPRHPVNQRLRAEVVYNTPLKPPIHKGDQVAFLHVRSSSGATNNVPLYAAEEVKSGGTMRRGLDSLFHLAFGWLP